MGRYNQLIFCSFLSILCPTSGSVLDWLTGSSSSTENPGGSPLPQYPEESGECSHWGNAALLPFEGSSHLGFGMPLRGDLVGSHRRVPVGTIVLVTNMRNGNTVRVRVVPPRTTPVLGRVMDLSPAAFSQLETLGEGVFTCSVKMLQTPRAEAYSLHSPKSGPQLGSGNFGFFKRHLQMNPIYPPIL